MFDLSGFNYVVCVCVCACAQGSRHGQSGQPPSGRFHGGGKLTDTRVFLVANFMPFPIILSKGRRQKFGGEYLFCPVR